MSNPTAEAAMFTPPAARAMHVLDRSFFSKTISLAAAVIQDNSQIHSTRQQLKHDVLDVGKIHSVVSDPSTKQKMLLLGTHVQPSNKATWGETLTGLVQQNKVFVMPYELKLDYKNWSYYILKAIIPEQDELPTGFSMTGHVAHLNLRSQYLQYKSIIAQVLMDKNPAVRTVINKIDDVGSENEFRTFKYELLAGDPSLNVETKEQDCVFRFNYADVYWNSRLSHEHERLVAKFQPGEAVCDLMAGVGPFAVPAGKKKIFVWANDLNPASYKGLVDAIKLNHVGQFVKPSNSDAREFVRTSATALLQDKSKVDVTPKPKKGSRSGPASVRRPSKVWMVPPKTFDHYVMNLPASATTFLDAFIGVYAGQEGLFGPETGRKLPMVHVYCFGAKSDDTEQIEKDICGEISTRIAYIIERGSNELEIHDVRDVAPQKRMFCASFRLPAQVAFKDSRDKRPTIEST